MQSKSIIIKSQNKNFIYALKYKLQDFPEIKFVFIKINCFYTLTIKCFNYYNNKISSNNFKYKDYTFLCTILSFILSDLFLEFQEPFVVKTLLLPCKKKNCNYSKFVSISNMLLDKNSPIILSENLFKKRKFILLKSLFQNFKKCNYIFTDYFLFFSTPVYLTELKNIFKITFILSKNINLYNFIISTFLKNN